MTEKIQKEEKPHAIELEFEDGDEKSFDLHASSEVPLSEEDREKEMKKEERRKKKRIQEKVKTIKEKYNLNYVRPVDRKNYLVEIAKKLMRFPEKLKDEKDSISA